MSSKRLKRCRSSAPIAPLEMSVSLSYVRGRGERDDPRRYREVVPRLYIGLGESERLSKCGELSSPPFSALVISHPERPRRGMINGMGEARGFQEVITVRRVSQELDHLHGLNVSDPLIEWSAIVMFPQTRGV